MLEHFVEAQEPIYQDALAELRAGDKRTHWMWFIFPQLRGLGRSEHAIRYGLADLSEAKAYLAHTVLGPRLRECTHALLAVEGKSASEILHSPDDLKFRSSMTLFLHAAADPKPFRAALDKYYGGELDPLTVELLGRDAP
jgi:uncharacterized protein (DUF1810 family)